MKYPELCERLIKETGEANVRYGRYPHLGAADFLRDPTIIREHHGIFDVGGSDRGEWISTAQFESEEEACDYIYKNLTQKPEIWVRTPEEIRHDKEVSAAFNAKMKAEDEAWVAAYRAREGLDPEPTE